MSFGIRPGLFTAVMCASAATPLPAQQDSLDLARALRLARERSPILAAAEEDVEAARGVVAAARSGRLPRLSAGGLYLRYEDPPSLPLGPLGAFAPFTENVYVAVAHAAQTLYSSGRISASVRSARASARGAALARAQAEVEVTATVARAHDDALLARSLEDVAERSAAVLRRAVQVAAAHYDEGTAARLDLLRAETRLSSAEAAVRAARDAAVAARERLAALLGLDPAAAPPVAGQLQVGDARDPRLGTDFILLAGSAHPAVEARRAAAEAARARARAARAARKPVVGLFFTGLTSRPELVTGDREWAWELLGGVSVSLPIYEGGESAGIAAVAEAEAARAMAEAAEAELAVAAAVRVQRRALVRGREDIAAARKNVGRAERALAIAEERYADGIGLQLEVLEAEAELTRVRAELLQAIHAYRLAAVELRRALGVPADAQVPAAGEGR